MNAYRLAVFAGVAVCVIVTLAICYKKFWVKWADNRAWRKDQEARNEMFARQVEMTRQRIAATKNGRTPRTTTGTPINRGRNAAS